MSSFVRKALPLVATAAVLATLLGLLRASLKIAFNGYLSEGAYVLALLEIQRSCNRYLLAFGAFLALAWLGSRALNRVGILPLDRRSPRMQIAARAALAAATLLALGGLAFQDLEPFVLNFLRGNQLIGTAVRNVLFVTTVTLTLAGASLLLARSRAVAGSLRAALALARHSAVSYLLVPVVASLAFVNVMVLERSRRQDGPNVVLITIDTLRADHLASYGYPRVTSPNLDALAEKGILFERAFSQAPWTLPSMASLHTSLYPSEHGAFSFAHRLPERLTTLAERFRNEGYRTVAVISNGFVDRTYGFAQGFDVFDQDHVRDHSGDSSREVTDAGIGYLRKHQARPLFLWLHYFDPHYDYIEHPEFPFGKDYSGPLPPELHINALNSRAKELTSKDLAYVQDLYDGEIAFTDREIGRVLDELDRLGLSDRTIIAVTADHGEEFLERGRIGHGKELYDEQIRVPILLYDPTRPGAMGGRIRQPVEVRNLAPTLLTAAGIDADGFDGPDLLRLAEERMETHAFSEGSYSWGDYDEKNALVRGEWKLIHEVETGTFELYNLAEDSKEARDLAASSPEVVHAMLPLLQEKLRERGEDVQQPVHLDPEQQRRLKSLGYIQ